MIETFFWTFTIFLTPIASPSPSWAALLPGEKNCPEAALIYPDDLIINKIVEIDDLGLTRAENSTGEISIDGSVMPSEVTYETARSNGTCPCPSRSCIAMCCPEGQVLRANDCVMVDKVEKVSFPRIFNSLTLNPSELDLNSEGKDLNGSFHIFVWDPCHNASKWRLNPKVKADEFKLLDNGSIYTVHDQNIIGFENYCLAFVDGDIFSVVQCFDMDYEAPEESNSSGLKMAAFMPIGLVLSVPCLIATFVVYSVLPELDNMHGMILRAYVGQLGLAYTLLATLKIVPVVSHNQDTCVTFAFIIHFSFLSSFFWLNVMCFDIWWTFGGFRALQGSVKQRERKKFIIYSLYAWGSASLITGVCLIMDFVPSIPDSFIKPRFGETRCWFPDEISKAVYFYGPMGVTVVCNIVLFISTALKILQHKRDTETQLKGIDSRRHDDNKQWFNLYLKLFIVMGINWSMEIISWLLNKDTPQYVWYLTDLANTLQGVIIFIIFVWKDKIRRLLMKRFGCQRGKFQSGNSTRSGYHSSVSNKTCTSIALQDKTPVERNRVNTTTDESDCV
ncbi:G-protein coupled receptor Mth2-like isoform X1 [Diachasmimorpha longicaudata]|uniref:G-protein coupled receptor Mth2-like isoform X1 n=1 Tax=Diachasmimorpha longicaudata TaxID=58733 RepID=UPI0030B8FE77